MLRDACRIEGCKGARFSGLNFSQLLQGDQEVASERAIFSSSEYPKMSSVQDAGNHFTLFIDSENSVGTWSFFSKLLMTSGILSKTCLTPRIQEAGSNRVVFRIRRSKDVSY